MAQRGTLATDYDRLRATELYRDGTIEPLKSRHSTSYQNMLDEVNISKGLAPLEAAVPGASPAPSPFPEEVEAE